MLVNSNSSEYIFRVLGTTKERGFYSNTEDLREIIEIKFTDTVACVGNPRLRLESGAVQVEAPFSMVVSPHCLGYYTLAPGQEMSQGRGRCDQCTTGLSSHTERRSSDSNTDEDMKVSHDSYYRVEDVLSKLC